MLDVNAGDCLSEALHIHSCSQCDGDYLSKYAKPPQGGGLCRRCVERVYNEASRRLHLREETLKAFRDEDEQKRRETEKRRAERRSKG